MNDFDAVVDTNALIDFYSCHDLYNAYESIARETATGAAFNIENPRAVYRRARARESLLLVLYFHERRLRTYSLHDEFETKLTKFVPPSLPPGNDPPDEFTQAFTTEVVHVVAPHVLPGWDAQIAQFEEPMAGNRADHTLCEKAQELRVPLITNEGYRESGVLEDVKLRKRAKEAGVPVFTPREFWEGKFDEEAACASFFVRLKEAAHQRIADGPAHLPDLYPYIAGYYRHVVYGVTAGRDRPASVRTRTRSV